MHDDEPDSPAIAESEVGNAYRNGKVMVCEKQCTTCIFRPGNLMRLAPGRVENMVKNAIVEQSAIICHDTLDGDNAVCRGFFDRHKHDTVLGMAERLGVIEEVRSCPPS
jgi:hypothetical protein